MAGEGAILERRGKARAVSMWASRIDHSHSTARSSSPWIGALMPAT
ncbi:hypothetical protein HLH26_08565 [Gluconacetobacter sp. 1b LMG 1731]|uniref:Uncharacterized protein n=1 Tax=Gluconacetobacter dulcium TaxID=2729096 RepID=A0A7W4NUT4_9PROT|nr:hypothetical protein [Gluconacetobacter dulcium]MBB2164593.1 hypothetical protein [Gluconacetobacter dulcium]MBB2193640.1 hypothetical protein [Gluconacetobacter dulcium]